MAKVLLREYYALCEGGVCQDLLTEEEKRFVSNGGMMLSGKLQEADESGQDGVGIDDHVRAWARTEKRSSMSRPFEEPVPFLVVSDLSTTIAPHHGIDQISCGLPVCGAGLFGGGGH